MTEQNSRTHQKTETERTPAAKAGRTASKVTAPASRAAKSAAATADEAASAAESGVERSAESAAGVVHAAARGVEAGRQAVIATSGQVAATAKTAWTVVAQRKLVAAGVGVGLTALSAASYAVGRRAGNRTQGPLTRLTGGRI
ncbi:hypothetical protein ABZ876_23220 [Streptomyces sp. NPDC046931]|uniref:hypothetical protein n=1 Tax=Streptomyces sp. NPDC046931 TaxID=3154806 RepID=UPI0033CB1E86